MHNPEIFCYWLQGFMEVANPETVSEVQLEEIKNHLELLRINMVIEKTQLRNKIELKIPTSNYEGYIC